MFESIINYIQRNPLTTIIIVMLLVFAPSAFGVLIIGIGIAVLLLLAVPVFMLFRLRRMSRKSEQQDRQGGLQGGFYTYTNSSQRGHDHSSEGEVRVHSTSSQPQKRVKDNVGDYVDFEEIKEKR